MPRHSNERTSGVPEVWDLVSAELDSNGLTVDIRRVDGRTLTFSFLVTSGEAIALFRLIEEIVSDEIKRLGKLEVVLNPIEPENPDGEYYNLRETT